MDGENPMVPPPAQCECENLLAMKSIILLIGLGLLTLVGTVGCEEEHEHYHHGATEGPRTGTTRGYGYGSQAYPGWPDGYHH